MADCQSKLLDVITHNIGDSYTQVAECSKCSLRQVRAEVNGVSEILEQRLYDIATRLPRKVSRHGMCLLKVERMFLVNDSGQISFSVNIFCHWQLCCLVNYICFYKEWFIRSFAKFGCIISTNFMSFIAPYILIKLCNSSILSIHSLSIVTQIITSSSCLLYSITSPKV